METTKVRDVMTREVITVAPGTALHDVARIMAEHGVSGAPVVDADGQLIGVISEADFLVKERGRPARDLNRTFAFFGRRTDDPDRRRIDAENALQAMSTPPVTIAEDRTLREAAAVMIDRGVNRLPVVTDGRLVGIVTRADVVRAYVGRDDVTLGAIRDEILRDTMWIDPDSLDVEVHEGHVRLAGAVDRRSTATIIQKLVGLVEGVHHVESFLTWDLDDARLPPIPHDREPGSASMLAREHPRSLHG